MDSIGQRLREEREALQLNQADFAALGNVNRNAQGNYETDKRQPDAAYLAAVAARGVDVQYVLTGRRAAPLAGTEAELLARFKAASPELRAAALSVLGVAATGSSAKYNVLAGGSAEQVLTGDGIRQDQVTFNVGRGSKKGEEK